MSEWQPIETAPETGFFLVYEGGAVRAMLRYEGEWKHAPYPCIVDEFGDAIAGDDAMRLTGGRRLEVRDCIHAPTHWMPIPPPPGEQ